jgi:hypothetical protein
MKKCICIENWKDYKIGDVTTYSTGQRTWFISGQTISYSDFVRHFKSI